MSEQKAKQAAEDYHKQGYALVRGFLPKAEIAALQAETARMYEEGMKHPKTFRHGNLVFEILPEEDFGRRYVIQAYWMSWISSYFENFRRRAEYHQVLSPFLGQDIKQVAQQIHWKPPGAKLTGYRFHQDLRFREARDAYDDVVASTITTGLAIDPCTKENGCLHVFPGTHKMGYLGLSDQGDGQIMKGLTHEEELRAAGLDPAGAVALEMEPGDLAVWGLLTVHGSLPNTSAKDRAFAISSYVRGDAQRGEWAFKGGVSTPLGDHPVVCKDEKLHEHLEPHYVESEWYR